MHISIDSPYIWIASLVVVLALNLIATFLKYNRAIKKLQLFKQTFHSYYGHIDLFRNHLDDLQKQIRLNIRRDLNKLAIEAKKYIRQIEISTLISPTMKSQVLGLYEPVEFFDNIFDFYEKFLPRENAINILDQAIGSYELRKQEFIAKLYNPLKWPKAIIQNIFQTTKNETKYRSSAGLFIWKFILGAIAILGFIFNFFWKPSCATNQQVSNYHTETVDSKLDSLSKKDSVSTMPEIPNK